MAADIDISPSNPRDIWNTFIQRPTTDAHTINAIEATLMEEGTPFDTPEHFAAAILETVEAEADRGVMTTVRAMLNDYAEAFNAEVDLRGEAAFLLGFACGQRARGMR